MKGKNFVSPAATPLIEPSKEIVGMTEALGAIGINNNLKQ